MTRMQCNQTAPPERSPRAERRDAIREIGLDSRGRPTPSSVDIMTRSLLLLLLAHATMLSAQAPVPMHEEPHHRLVLTHEQLRVMDVKVGPGDTTLFHRHDVPALYVAVAASPVDIQLLDGKWIGTQPAADQGRKPGDVNVDTSYISVPITHRVTNVGAQLFNLIAITTSTVSPRDPGAPEMPGHVELLNRWFTQSRLRLSAGAAPRWYSARSSTIVVQPVQGAVTVRLESGEKHVLSTPGSWALVPAGDRYQLTSPSSATLVVVQVR